MKLLKKIRKGFTLIELVVVIAVIAILAAVSVVSYVSITNKAHQSNDQQKVDQLNLSLQAAEISGKPKTMSEALEALEDDGFLPEKFKAEAKNYEFAYAFEANRFVIVEKGQSVVYPKENKAAISADIWKFAASNDGIKADGASYYLMEGCEGAISTKVDGGVDVGKNKDITAFSVESSQAKLVINSGGDQCVVTINAPSADVDYYGFAKRVDVKDVKSTSLHIYGSVAELQLEKGHAQIESTGIVFDVVQVGTVAEGTGASITNNGFIADVSLSEHEDPVTHEVPEAVETAVAGNMSGKGESKTLEVGSLAQFEAFRDAVNAGNDFYGLTVKLTKDIALSDGWKPIGEGTRKVVKDNLPQSGSSTFFRGTFDGQNHTISNLNNKGFEPTEARLASTSPKQYSYGLFALVNGAKIKNVTLSNVNINKDEYSGAEMDSVAALVGASVGPTEISGVTVSGTISGDDAVCGIVGRVFLGANTVSITDCVSSCTITSKAVCAGIVRAYNKEAGYKFILTGNTNTGTVTTTSSVAYSGALAIFSDSIELNVGVTNPKANMNMGHEAVRTTSIPSSGNESKLA